MKRIVHKRFVRCLQRQKQSWFQLVGFIYIPLPDKCFADQLLSLDSFQLRTPLWVYLEQKREYFPARLMHQKRSVEIVSQIHRVSYEILQQMLNMANFLTIEKNWPLSDWQPFPIIDSAFSFCSSTHLALKCLFVWVSSMCDFNQIR